MNNTNLLCIVLEVENSKTEGHALGVCRGPAYWVRDIIFFLYLCIIEGTVWFSKASCECLRVCLHVCVFLCDAQVCASMWESQADIQYLWWLFYTLFFMRQDLSLAWGSPVWLDLQDSEAQGSSVSAFPGSTAVYCHTQLFRRS